MPMRDSQAWPFPADQGLPSLLPATNDAVVRVVLLWARRTGCSIAAVGEVCAYLGVDLNAALTRAATGARERNVGSDA